MGLIASSNGDFVLTPAGQESALHIIRAHRLWERYLADETGFSEAEWHAQAEFLEHELEPSDVNALSAQLGNPLHDPHGDPIPTAGGDLVTHGGMPLPALEQALPVGLSTWRTNQRSSILSLWQWAYIPD